jgi:hypothetical protein
LLRQRVREKLEIQENKRNRAAARDREKENRVFGIFCPVLIKCSDQ